MLNMMEPSAYSVNEAQGSIVDEKELIRTLKEHRMHVLL
ncbi:NAD(P)-dependent oxidoreductase [Sporolactobacillus pectinivorans]